MGYCTTVHHPSCCVQHRARELLLDGVHMHWAKTIWDAAEYNAVLMKFDRQLGRMGQI